MSEAPLRGTVAIVGCGSIGSRHARNLASLGVQDILLLDADERQAARLAQTIPAHRSASLDDLCAQRPEIVLVCTPPNQHLDVARAALQTGSNVFIEKPLSQSLAGVDALLAEAQARQRLVMVGYNLRHEVGLRLVERLLREGAIGQLLSVSAIFAQYLPDWRPQTDYRGGYITRPDGGIILDASHEIDYVRWLAGDFASVWCTAENVSQLAMAAEDLAAMTFRLASGGVAEIHVDCVRRGYTRRCELTGERGTLVWEFGQAVRLYDAQARNWRTWEVDADPNAMYVEEMRELLACLAGTSAPMSDGANGRRVLQIALAAKQSAREHVEVPL